MDLQRRDAIGRTDGCANFRGEIGEGGQVVTGEGGGDGKLTAGDLDSVSGIAGKPNDDGFKLHPGLCQFWGFELCTGGRHLYLNDAPVRRGATDLSVGGP